ncbi:hypothetical protein CCP3SC1AL1_410016 [Gammaproteobacteria bacterium]
MSAFIICLTQATLNLIEKHSNSLNNNDALHSTFSPAHADKTPDDPEEVYLGGF